MKNTTGNSRKRGAGQRNGQADRLLLGLGLAGPIKLPPCNLGAVEMKILKGVVKHDDAKFEVINTALRLAVQAERLRMAQVLHDDVAQSLFVARMRLSAIIQSNSNPAVGESLRIIEECLTASSDAARAMMAALDLPMLTERRARLDARVARRIDEANSNFGQQKLLVALMRVSEQFMRRHGLIVEVSGACRVEPSLEVRAVVLRSVRELLMNVVKYAKVTHAKVDLEGDDRWLKVHVSDEGAGYDVTALRHHAPAVGGYGLRSIDECLAMRGSRMEVVSAPGQGTKVTLVMASVGKRHILKHGDT